MPGTARGPKNGTICGATSNPTGSERCGRHPVGGRTRKSKLGAGAVVLDPNEIPNYESDGEIGGGIDGLEIPGCDPAVSRSLERDRDSIDELLYRGAFSKVHDMKDKTTKEPEPVSAGCEDADGNEAPTPRWQKEGLEDENSAAYTARNKDRGGPRFHLAPTTLETLPHLNRAGLRILRDAVRKCAGSFAFWFYNLACPPVAIELVKNQSNDYIAFCTKVENPHTQQQQRHRDKKVFKGHAEVPEVVLDDGTTARRFDTKHVYGMLGVLITMGITQKRRMANHWGTTAHDDYPLVRNCMSRDFFLLYPRFLHVASAVSAKRGDPAYDSKHYIRGLEDLLNMAWSTIAVPGEWLAFDEQMAKSTARAMHGIMRFNKAKSIKHGIRDCGVCRPSGFAFVQSVDGGFMGDPMLRQYDGCPLARTTRMVLVVLLRACPALAAHLDGSRVKVAMDNYFTSPVLALCLAEHCLWVVGTVRKNRTGVGGAAQFWDDNGMVVKKRVDTVFAQY